MTETKARESYHDAWHEGADCVANKSHPIRIVSSMLLRTVLMLILSGPTLARAEDPPQSPATSESKTEPQENPRDRVAPEVLVTGSLESDGVPIVPIDNIGSRDVFTPEQVKETGARDLNDLVQNLPGVSTRPYNGGEAAAPSFSTRGLPDDGLTEYLHVLIDGVPTSALPYGWTAFSFLPITVERVYAIDQIRAAHSVRYSPNTVGGVVNFLTEPIPEQSEVEMGTTIGSFGYVSNSFRIGGTDGRLGAQVTYVDRRGEGFRDDGEFDQQDFNLKLRYALDDGDWIAASFGYMVDEHQAPGGLTREQFNEDRFANARPDNRFEGFRTVFDTVYHCQLDEDAWLEAFAYGSATGRDLKGQLPQFGEPTELRQTRDVAYFAGAGVRTQHIVELFDTEHTIFAGVRVHQELFPNSPTRTKPIDSQNWTRTSELDAQYQTVSAHIDDTFSPVDNLDITLGARMEWVPTTEGEDDITGFDFDDEFFRILPGIGASYMLTDDWSVFASYFEGFRAPQVWGFRFARDDGDLEFELGRTAEVGTRFRGFGGFEGALALWRVEYDDFGVFYSEFYENLGRIVSRGTDVELDWYAGDVFESLEGFSISGSITFTDAELRSGDNAGNEVPYAWDHKATWRARYERDDWTFSIGGVTVGEAFSDDANTREESDDGTIGLNTGWTLWDARVAKSLALTDDGILDLAVGMTNLFDREWEVHSRGGFFGGGLVAGAPRQAYASAGLTFRF